MVKEGDFEFDLLSRLKQAIIHIATLRERPTEIPLLAKHLYDKAIKEKVKKDKSKYDDLTQLLNIMDFLPLTKLAWLGNVRELENKIKTFVYRNFNYLRDIKPSMIVQLIENDNITVKDLLAAPPIEEYTELKDKHWAAINAYVNSRFDQTEAMKEAKAGDSRTLLKYVRTILLVAGGETDFDATAVADWVIERTAISNIDKRKLVAKIKLHFQEIKDMYPNYKNMSRKPWEPWALEIAEKLSQKNSNK